MAQRTPRESLKSLGLRCRTFERVSPALMECDVLEHEIVDLIKLRHEPVCRFGRLGHDDPAIENSLVWLRDRRIGNVKISIESVVSVTDREHITIRKDDIVVRLAEKLQPVMKLECVIKEPRYPVRFIRWGWRSDFHELNVRHMEAHRLAKDAEEPRVLRAVLVVKTDGAYFHLMRVHQVRLSPNSTAPISSSTARLTSPCSGCA